MGPESRLDLRSGVRRSERGDNARRGEPVKRGESFVEVDRAVKVDHQVLLGRFSQHVQTSDSPGAGSC